MAETILRVENIKGLKDGVNAMFEIFVRIGDLHREDTAKIVSVMDKLKRVDETQWQTIRQKFLVDNYTGYIGSSTPEQQKTDPARLLIDFTHTLDSIKANLLLHMEDWYKNDETRKQETRRVQDQLQEVQAELSDIRWRYKKDSASLAAATAANERLEEVIKEKSEKISELSRQSTVQLWEREKARVLEAETARTKELGNELERVKTENATLSHKIQEMENKFKIEKMKNDLHLKPTSHETGAEIDRLQKYTHYLEQDLRGMETALHSQMKYAIGVLNGLKTDFWRLFEDILSSREEPYPMDEARIQGVKKLNDTLETCHIAARHGKLNQLRADLKDVYVSTDKDVVTIPVRKLSTAFNIHRAQIAMYEAAHRKTGGTAPSGRLSPLEGRRQSNVTAPNPLDDRIKGVTSYASPGNGTVHRKTAITNEVAAIVASNASVSGRTDHPVFVSPSGYINMIRVLQNFPHMTKEYVQDQWDQFKSYDTDGNGTLDLTEMVTAMSSTIGQHFTATQIKDAMLEVDADGSESIDFFEYLSVANMLMHKHGRSEVFRSKIVQQQARTVSKTCSIQ